MYRINDNEACSAFVRRVIGEEVDAVCALLATTARGPVDFRVHQARVHLKKLRAMFELCAETLEPDSRRREIRAARAAARALAELRAPVALVEAFDRTVSHFPDVLPTTTLTALRGWLRRSGTDSARSTALAMAREHMTRMRSRVVSLRIERDGWTSIGPGFVKTYARARRAYRRAHKGTARTDTEELHTFRRWSKRHSYQLQLLEPLWPGPLRAQRKEISKLSQRLGHDHDLSLLTLALSRRGTPTPRPGNLRNLIVRRRTTLQASALAAGEKLFAEKPAALGHRFTAYFAAFSAGPVPVKRRRPSQSTFKDGKRDPSTQPQRSLRP